MRASRGQGFTHPSYALCRKAQVIRGRSGGNPVSETFDYLAENFVGRSELAERCSISVGDLTAAIERGILPRPSYVVAGDTLHSSAFGPIQSPGLQAGDYFHRDMALWTEGATAIVARHGLDKAAEAMKQAFLDELSEEFPALVEAGLTPPPCLGESGGLDATLTSGWLVSHWDAHIQGIFGVCVRRPGSIRQILLKETLQSMLSALTDNGARLAYSTEERRALDPLISQFAQACAPFTPVEYPRTSRKRFVEDLPLLLV